jgi:molecular chaperone GrpE
LSRHDLVRLSGGAGIKVLSEDSTTPSDVLQEDKPDDGTEELPSNAASPAFTRQDAAEMRGDLAGRLDQVAEQLADFHRRSAHRESVIDHLHAENRQLQSGMNRAVLDPVVSDLIRLYDQIDREVRRLKAAGQDERLLWSFADDVAMILDRCGIESYSAEQGDAFDRDRHRPVGVVESPEESRNNTVAGVTAVGFADRASGRVRRPVQAQFYKYAPASGAAQGDAPQP